MFESCFSAKGLVVCCLKMRKIDSKPLLKSYRYFSVLDKKCTNLYQFFGLLFNVITSWTVFKI